MSGSPEEPGGRRRADRRATEQHQQGLRFLLSLPPRLLIPGWEKGPASGEGGGRRPGFWGPEKGKGFCHDLEAASLRRPALHRGVLRRTQTLKDLDVRKEGKKTSRDLERSRPARSSSYRGMEFHGLDSNPALRGLS